MTVWTAEAGLLKWVLRNGHIKHYYTLTKRALVQSEGKRAGAVPRALSVSNFLLEKTLKIERSHANACLDVFEYSEHLIFLLCDLTQFPITQQW